jgi:PIN domain nuclease of toxin-antitoxin system
MKWLLDTNAFLWYVLDDTRLTMKAREVLEDAKSDLFLSPASYWEPAIKVSLGKYRIPTSLAAFLKSELTENGIAILPIRIEHAARLVSLPFHHRDPFDRMIVAQALAEDMPLISSDEAIDAYGISRCW